MKKKKMKKTKKTSEETRKQKKRNKQNHVCTQRSDVKKNREMGPAQFLRERAIPSGEESY